MIVGTRVKTWRHLWIKIIHSCIGYRKKLWKLLSRLQSLLIHQMYVVGRRVSVSFKISPLIPSRCLCDGSVMSLCSVSAVLPLCLAVWVSLRVLEASFRPLKGRQSSNSCPHPPHIQKPTILGRSENNSTRDMVFYSWRLVSTTEQGLYLKPDRCLVWPLTL